MIHERLSSLSKLAAEALGALQGVRAGLLQPGDLGPLADAAMVALPQNKAAIASLLRLSSGRPFLASNLALGIREAAIKEGVSLATETGLEFEWQTQWERPFAGFEALEARLLREFDRGVVDAELVVEFGHLIDRIRARLESDPDEELAHEVGSAAPLLGRVQAHLRRSQNQP